MASVLLQPPQRGSAWKVANIIESRALCRKELLSRVPAGSKQASQNLND